MDPLHNPLREHEYVPTNEQGSLFEVEDRPSVEYTAKANAAWNQANQKVTQWREQSLDLVTVFDDRFPSRPAIGRRRAAIPVCQGFSALERFRC